MALVLKDRVRETAAAPGTGTVTLLGAVLGYQTFAAIGNGNTTYYTIAQQGGAGWEVGIGTYSSSGTTLSRDTVLSNSLGTTAKIDFSSGTQDVFATYPSERAVYLDGTTLTPDNLTIVEPEIANTIKLTGAGAAAYTPFVQTFSSSVTDYDGYQLNYIQNTNDGSDASVDYVAYNDASDVDSYFIDMGIVSKDVLSNLQASFGYQWNANERVANSFARVSYQGFFPVIDFNYESGNRFTELNLPVANNQFALVSDQWRQTKYSLGVRIPFNLTQVDQSSKGLQ